MSVAASKHDSAKFPRLAIRVAVPAYLILAFLRVSIVSMYFLLGCSCVALFATQASKGMQSTAFDVSSL